MLRGGELTTREATAKVAKGEEGKGECEKRTADDSEG